MNSLPSRLRIVIGLLLVLASIGMLVFLLRDVFDKSTFGAGDGYLYAGEGWQSTPEEAAAYQAENGWPEYQAMFTIKHLLQKIPMNDGGFLLVYLSGAESFVTLYCVTNEAGYYHTSGWSAEENLFSPSYAVLNGDPEQVILAPFAKDGNRVFGWKYSSAPDVTVNGILAQTETYRFTLHNWEWEIDYFWVDGITGEVELAYVNAEP